MNWEVATAVLLAVVWKWFPIVRSRDLWLWKMLYRPAMLIGTTVTSIPIKSLAVENRSSNLSSEGMILLL
jgi:hypothetical protein